MQSEFIKYLQAIKLDYIHNNNYSFRNAVKAALDEFLDTTKNDIPDNKKRFTVIVRYDGNIPKQINSTTDVICTGFEYIPLTKVLQLEVYSANRKNVIDWLRDNLEEFDTVTFI